LPASSGPISSLIDVLLGHEDELPAWRHERGMACRWPDSMKPPTPGYESCPAVSRDPLRTAKDPTIYAQPSTR
jgi:hypothetical protein